MTVPKRKDKYVVFKREEWQSALDRALYNDKATFRVLSTMEGGALDDAFVIRTQDRFAEAGLYAYASALVNAAEIMKDAPITNSLERKRVDELSDRLIRIADVATLRAVEAHGAKRMPT